MTGQLSVFRIIEASVIEKLNFSFSSYWNRRQYSLERRVAAVVEFMELFRKTDIAVDGPLESSNFFLASENVFRFTAIWN